MEKITSSNHSDIAGNIEIIRRVYSGINRNDVDSVIDLMDEDITRVEFEELPIGVTYRGLTNMRRHLVAGRSTWAEGRCEPADFYSAGNKTVVAVHVKVRLRDNPEWIDEQIADGFIIEEGKVTEFHSFSGREKAFEWAGIKHV